MKTLLVFGAASVGLSLAATLAEDPFAAAAQKRKAAEQRARDRAAKTEQPAREKREAMGRLPDWLQHPESKEPLGSNREVTVSFATHGADRTDTTASAPQDMPKQVLNRPTRSVTSSQPGSVYGTWLSQIDVWAGRAGISLPDDVRQAVQVAQTVSVEVFEQNGPAQDATTLELNPLTGLLGELGIEPSPAIYPPVEGAP